MDFDLESLVHVEQSFYDEGYKDGFDHGRIHGLIEGRALGREKGFEMWEELGFYEGFALLWKGIQEAQGVKDDRTAHNIRHLLELTAQFPRANPSATDASELDIPRLFRQIRSRYKALCAMLGVKPTLRASGSSPAQEATEDPGKTPVASEEGNGLWKIDDTRVSVPPKDYSF
ncbi:hypothetical protein BDY19DRAFT_987455 [Irpex rosettiformis]|uniref:Uncharacterized protein n=1 Tax=Irpex rosettiformis TaxID=378272 RepID=A0ACB8TR98_9APHY|nr:hypothetical protein BDY19DRAFT_987455 [Irpex rosettiformis]